MKKLFLHSLIVVIALTFWPHSCVQAQDAESSAKPKRVLAIFGFKQGLPFAYRMAESLHMTMTNEFGSDLVLDIEYTDRMRFPENEYLARIMDLYRYKYGENPLDLILLVGDESTDLILEKGKDLFAGVPVVLVSTVKKKLPPGRSPSNTVSMVWGIDFGRTLNLIENLLPQTQHIYVVSGQSPTDEKFRRLAAAALKKSETGFEAHFLNKYSMDGLYEKIAHLPRNSVLLFLSMFRDARGEYFVSRDVVAGISKKANAPTFGNIDLYLGQGIVGGDLVSADYQGQKYARISQQILNGVPLENLESTQVLNQIELDWRQLKRWSIDEERVPPNSLIRYRPSSLWRDHKWELAGIGLLVLIQAVALVGLVIQYRRRSLAEDESLRLRDERARISRVLAMGEIAASLAHELNQPLSAVRGYAQAAQRFLKKEPIDTGEINTALEGAIAGNRRAEEVIKRIRMALKNEPSQQVSLRVDEIIPEVLQLVRRNAVKKNVTLEYHPAVGLPLLKGDRIQLQQVLFNLIINGVEAMPENAAGKGKIVVRAWLDDEGAVTISVCDNGTGIDEQTAAAIFDSFYTTKAGGMGLGLSISRSIIEDHGGRLWADRNLEQGTTFSFSLPRHGRGG